MKDFISGIVAKYYPHDPRAFYEEKEQFYTNTIPTQSEFVRRIEYYVRTGKPEWVSGRNGLSDDISLASLKKA